MGPPGLSGPMGWATAGRTELAVLEMPGIGRAKVMMMTMAIAVMVMIAKLFVTTLADAWQSLTSLIKVRMMFF